MSRLLAVLAALVTAGVTGCFGAGSATADDSVAPAPPTPGTAYALGGAHVLGIPYDEYIRRTGADWFPGMKREKVDYPAGQVQGHVLERLFPGIGPVGEEIHPGLGLDGPSIGDPIAKTPFGESFLTQMFPVGSVVPAMDYRIPAPVESQYHTDQFVSAYDSIADFPDRPDNLFALANSIAGLATGHTAIAFTNPSNVPPQNIRTTVNSRGATTTTYLIPEQHLPLVLPFKYLGFGEDTLNQLDAILLPRVNAGYSRNDDPATAPVQVDPVHGFDPAAVTAPANEATFGGGGGGGADPISQLINGAMSVLSNGAR